MISKPAPTETEIHPLLQNRWSGRAFDAARPIEGEKLVALAEAARWSPSSMNAQPWRFTPVIRGQDRVWDEVIGALAPANQVWANEAPLLLVVAAETRFEDGKPNRWAPYDTGAAMMALSIEATSLGLMVHQMGGFNTVVLKEVLDAPDHWEMLTVAAIGYQLPQERIPAALIEREMAERKRFATKSIWLSPRS